MVLIIGIGKYLELIEGLVESFKYMPESISAEFILFTDDVDREFIIEKKFKIFRKFQPDYGWPMNTLLRYRMFSEVIEQISSMNISHVFFMNANLRLIDGELFNKINKSPLFFVRHPGYSGLKNLLPKNFETRKDSSACCNILNVIFSKYVQGTLWGGERDSFARMIYSLNYMCEADLSKGVIPKVHDESYLNAFRLKTTNYQILDPSFSWPEGWKRERIHILSVNKNRILGEDYMNNLKYRK